MLPLQVAFAVAEEGFVEEEGLDQLLLDRTGEETGWQSNHQGLGLPLQLVFVVVEQCIPHEAPRVGRQDPVVSVEGWGFEHREDVVDLPRSVSENL